MTKKGLEIGAMITLLAGGVVSIVVWSVKSRLEAQDQTVTRIAVVESRIEGFEKRFDKLDGMVERVWDAVKRR